MDHIKDKVKRTQEQAIASWISYLNQLRLYEYFDNLLKQDGNLEEALRYLDKVKVFLGDPSKILGSNKTKHGEIAECLQVNLSNARDVIQGLLPRYRDAISRIAPEDYWFGDKPVQSKFYNGLKNPRISQSLRT